MSQLFVSTRKGLFVFERATRGWRIASRHFLGEPVTATLADSACKRWIAALRLGHFGVKLHVSDDAGGQWEEVSTPSYPPKPEADGGAEDPHPWTLDQVWILEGFHPKAPDRLWAGTNPGGLFRSDDGGRTWTLIESLWQMPERKQWLGGGYDIPGIHSICVHPRDSDDIVVGVSCGGAWRTRDGGATWSVGHGMSADFMPPERRQDPLIQDPHRIVQCASNPEVLWTQHHCGIWKSIDRGATWNEITTAKPSRFGFAVAVHPNDADTAWFVPAIKDEQRIPVNGELVVTRTRDGGKSFDVFRDGLPQHESYDLVYRHAMDIGQDGEVLAMASTTGGLWTSDQAGERWTLAAERMPPVYAVRLM